MEIKFLQCVKSDISIRTKRYGEMMFAFTMKRDFRDMERRCFTMNKVFSKIIDWRKEDMEKIMFFKSVSFTDKLSGHEKESRRLKVLI